MEKHIDEMEIRLLKPEDKARVYTFFRNLGDEGAGFFNYQNNNENGLYEFLDGGHQDRIYWAAMADDEVAGIVFLWSKDTKVPWLGIAVTEKWKGHHLGRRLMTTAKEWALAAGAGGILLTTSCKNVRGRGLYERMGYKHIGTYHDGEMIYLLSFPNESV